MIEIKRLILIDEDPSSNLLTAFVIRKTIGKGEVKIITKAKNALEYIQAEYSETENTLTTIILLEINLDIFSGWEFLDAFSELPEKIKNQFIIYLFSSSIDKKEKENAAGYPVISGIIEKPLSKESITRIYFFNNTLKKNKFGTPVLIKNN